MIPFSVCEKWIRCDGINIFEEGWCPEGELFDPIERFCDDEENVDCENPTQPPGQRPQWNWVCEPQHVGPERWPHPDCKFIFI